MAADFPGTNDWLEWDTAPLTIPTTAFSISVWLNLNRNDTGYVWCVKQYSGDTGGRFVLYFTGASGTMQFERPRSTTSLYINSSTYPTVDTWEHWLVTSQDGATSANSHIYQDGTDVCSGAGDGSGTQLTGAGTWVLGTEKGSSVEEWEGQLAEFGYWDRVLDSKEIAALAKGFSPMFFRRGLKSYASLLEAEDAWIDPVSGSGLTATGGMVGGFEHAPKIIRPSRALCGA
jgi:hypothetical protein